MGLSLTNCPKFRHFVMSVLILKDKCEILTRSLAIFEGKHWRKGRSKATVSKTWQECSICCSVEGSYTREATTSNKLGIAVHEDVGDI